MSVDNLVSVGTTREPEIDAYCTLTRENKRKNKSVATITKKRPVLTRQFSGSHENLYTGTRVSKVPEPTEYAVKVGIHVYSALYQYVYVPHMCVRSCKD